jgi:hypothetical protein
MHVRGVRVREGGVRAMLINAFTALFTMSDKEALDAAEQKARKMAYWVRKLAWYKEGFEIDAAMLDASREEQVVLRQRRLAWRSEGAVLRQIKRMFGVPLMMNCRDCDNGILICDSCMCSCGRPRVECGECEE